MTFEGDELVPTCNRCGNASGTWAVDAEDTDGSCYVELCTPCYVLVMGQPPRCAAGHEAST